MLANTVLFHPDNILLETSNPCCDPLHSALYGDFNTESWYLDAKK